MTRITKMDKVSAKVLGEATRAALEKVAAQFGVTVKAGGGRFDSDAGTFAPRVEFTIAATDGAPVGKDAAAFRAYAEMGIIPGGFDPSHLGATFSNGRMGAYRIIGYRPRKRQGLLAERVDDGKVFCFVPDAIARVMKIEPKAPTTTLELTDAPTRRVK